MKKDESAEKKYTSAEVTEMMYSMEEIRKQQQRQDKIAGYLAIPVMLIVAAIFKLSGHANFGGAVFAGLLGGLAPLSAHIIFGRIEKIRKAEKVYGFFTIVMTGIFLILCSSMIPDGFWEHHKQEATPYHVRCESSNCSIYVWIGDKENKQGEKESGNYYGCCSIGACVSDVDFAELCCQINRKC